MTPGGWRRLLGGGDGGGRTSGIPPSANGASSFHLSWQVDGGQPLVEVAATLTVVRPPTVPRLYFWALQASFRDGGRHLGAAHLGLQWHPSHPGSTAVNWGGYGNDGAELGGSASSLPSALANPNTRDFPWRPGVGYRLRIRRSPQGRGWRGEVTDTSSGATTAVRDLWAGGEHLSDPVVWSEVFARCDDPPAAVRWSDLAGLAPPAAVVRPGAVIVNYQSRAQGGCDNTDVGISPEGLVQVTNAPRRLRQGAVVRLP